MCCALSTLAVAGVETPSRAQPRAREWAGGPAARRLPVNPGIIVGPPSDPLEGSRIAYVFTQRDDTTHIMTTLPDGTGRFTVTQRPGDYSEPIWAPGGLQLAFVLDASGTSDIYLVEPDGTNIRQLTFGESARRPRWSPQGDSIVYLGGPGGRAGSLRVVDIASGEVRVLDPSTGYGFTWSPDGTRIAYTANAPRPTGTGGLVGSIRVVDHDGANIVELDNMDALYPAPAGVTPPIWERDMRFLRYGVRDGFGDGGKHIGTGRRVSVQGLVLQPDVPKGIPLAMSPDGTRFVAGVPTAEPGFPGSLHIVGTVGGNALRVSWPVGWTGVHYDWSPDGSSVVGAHWGSLYVIDAISGASREIVYAGGSHPSWRPRPTLPPDPRPSLVIEAPAADETLPEDATHVDMRIRPVRYDGPWQWSLNSPFPIEGQGGGTQVANGFSARIAGLRPGRWYTIHVAPVDASGVLLQPVFRMSQRFRVASPEPSADLADTLIAYVDGQDGEVYVTSPEGPGRVRVTDDGAEKGGVCWAPNGRRLAYSSNLRGTFDIWMIDSDGGGRTRVTEEDGDETDPAWSPDGSRIAFTRTVDGHRQIYSVTLEDSSLTELTRDGAAAREPSWSPDGSRIAVSMGSAGRLGVLDVSTGALARIGGEGEGPFRWSPLGGPLLMLRDINRDRFGFPIHAVHTVDPDGGHLTLLPGPITASEYSWSPDGSMIAVESRGKDGISVMLADGTNMRLLEGANPAASSPAWSPVPAPSLGVDDPPSPQADAPPTATRLLPNYPNPFARETTIPYDLRDAVDVAISVYAMDGSVVRRFAVGPVEPGRHTVAWDGRNDVGQPVARGVYFYEPRAGAYRSVRRLMAP